MNTFTKKQIRAIRGGETLVYQQYWVYIELFVNGRWIKPYFVNEEKLDWYHPNRKMYPSVENMKEYAEKALNYINKLLNQEGWEMVNKEKYEEIIDRHFNPLKYTPAKVYLD